MRPFRTFVAIIDGKQILRLRNDFDLGGQSSQQPFAFRMRCSRDKSRSVFDTSFSRLGRLNNVRCRTSN